MRVAEINMVNFGSTGRIALQIADYVRKNGGDAITFSTHVASKHYKKNPAAPEGQAFYGSYFGNNLHFLLGQITGKNCYFSRHDTKKLLRKLEVFKPDIVHLHNLHASYLNFPLLFGWLKSSGVKVVWTFHDCWPMTAKCPHFEQCGCEKWKTGCHVCEQLRKYPRAFIDRTKMLWQKKKEWAEQLQELTIVTPSYWLANLAKQSIYKDKTIQVIHTGIDLDIFKPTPSDFRTRIRCGNQFVILGVASSWNRNKGLDVFSALAKRLGSQFRIVLVGTTEQIDAQLPENIITIHKTQDLSELAKIYTAADLFVNPTREETLGLVNAEALACGTPVVTFCTGGSPEVIDKTCGSVVPRDDIDALEKEIIRISLTHPFSKADCMKRAKHFDAEKRLKDYFDIYEAILHTNG